ncbi:MAG TPA: LysR family transcriptional regulator [Burkholderiales bacterium]
MAKIASSDIRAQMEAFVTTVDQRGLTAAARRKDVTPSAISKLITRLEDRLDARLLNRTTRKLSLTPEGERFYERCRSILAALEDAENEVSRTRDRPRGRLRMTVFAPFGTHVLVPTLPRFLSRYPDVAVDLEVSDRIADLVAEGIDIAVRLGPLPHSTLVARKLCDVHRIVCASPAYLARAGMPTTPADLKAHNCIVRSDLPAHSQWPFEGPAGRETVHVTGNVSANNGETMLQLALAGMGIIRIVDMAVGDPFRRGELVPILGDRHISESVPLHALYLQGRHRSPRVSAMLQFLLDSFSHAPWR